MAAGLSGLHVFQTDVGPEALSLLDNNFTPIANALNTLSNFANYYVDSGAVNALAFNVAAPQIASAYTDGLQVQVKVGNTTTSTAPTLNISYLGNPLGAKTIFNPDGTALVSGQMVAGAIVELRYSTTLGGFQLVNGGVGGSLATGLFANGTAAAPSIAFLNSPGTGFYRSGADILGIATAGTQRGTVNASGNWSLAAPSSGTVLTLAGAAVAGATTALNISGQNLDVAGILLQSTTGTNAAGMQFTNTGSTFYVGVDNSTGSRIGALAYAGSMWNASANPLQFGTNNLLRMQISSSGNVTISAPGAGTALAVNALAAGIGQSWSDGTVTTRLDFNGTQTEFGSFSNHPLNFFTNNSTRLTIAAAGNVTIAAPSSGTALTITAVSSGNALLLNSGTDVRGLIINGPTGHESSLEFDINSSAQTYLGVAGATNQLLTGSAANDLVVRVQGNNFLVSTDSGASIGLKIAGANASISFKGPVAAALVDMTPDTGSYTGTLTGVTGGTLTITVTWARYGNHVILNLPPNTTNTSNATTFTITGSMPASIQPARQQFVMGDFENNGAIIIGAARVDPGSSTITLCTQSATGWVTSSWTASGAKGLHGMTVPYILN
jgi:hypothetical protein